MFLIAVAYIIQTTCNCIYMSIHIWLKMLQYTNCLFNIFSCSFHNLIFSDWRAVHLVDFLVKVLELSPHRRTCLFHPPILPHMPLQINVFVLHTMFLSLPLWIYQLYLQALPKQMNLMNILQRCWMICWWI